MIAYAFTPTYVSALEAFSVLEAEDMPTKTVGGETEYGWNLWSTGNIETTVTFPQTGIYQFDLFARQQKGGIYPAKAAILVDGKVIAYIPVTSTEWNKYSSSNSAYRKGLGNPWNIKAGKHRVSIAFINDFCEKPSGDGTCAAGDRNLLVDKLFIYNTYTQAPTVPTPIKLNLPLKGILDPSRLTIGAAVGGTGLLEGEANYRNTLLREFNLVVSENDMKVDKIISESGTFNFVNADAFMNFAMNHGLSVRGHNLVWHNTVLNYTKKYTRAQAINWLRNYIYKVVGRYKGKVKYWDVVNEALQDTPNAGGHRTSSFWYQKIGPEYIELAFKFAHEADPNAKLFYNDYGCESINEKSDGMYKLVAELIKKGVPIHGVGLQSHFDEAYPPDKPGIIDNMSRFAKLGLEIHVTELDVGIETPVTTEKLNDQAENYRLITEACLAVTACKNITTWGFTDNYSWRNDNGETDPLIFTRDYKPKAAYNAMQELLVKEKLR